jgi:hypothetical protein
VLGEMAARKEDDNGWKSKRDHTTGNKDPGLDGKIETQKFSFIG